MSLTSVERAALADLLDELGPDEPTLCEGWATRDLAAHLVIREGRPDVNAGIAIPLLAGRTARAQATLAAGDFTQLVDRVRTGPPTLSFFSAPGRGLPSQRVRVPRAPRGRPTRPAGLGAARAPGARRQTASGRGCPRGALAPLPAGQHGVTLQRPDGRVRRRPHRGTDGHRGRRARRAGPAGVRPRRSRAGRDPGRPERRRGLQRSARSAV